VTKVIVFLIFVGFIYSVFKILAMIFRAIAGKRSDPAEKAIKDYVESTRPDEKKTTKRQKTTSTTEKPTSQFDFTAQQSVKQNYAAKSNSQNKIKEERWVPPGKQITIHGKTIKGGMLYVQSGPSDRYGADPSLINVDLPRSPNRSCINNYGMSYWPSYSDISAEARSAYIDWLEKGRRVKDAYIGYVFLFFYGLERRFLVDDPSKKEMATIRDEISALLSVYSDNRSFRNYAENLLGIINVALGKDAYEPKINPNLIARGSYSPSFKVELGKCVVNKKPIPWDLALEWSLRDPETKLRVPAKRCPDEFASLFEE